MSDTQLHPSIVALVALSAHIASGHPDRGLCQLDKLKHYGVSEAQIDLAVEIARHIRDEAAQKLDHSFNGARGSGQEPSGMAKPLSIPIAAGACCTPTSGGNSCC
ncbi:MAG: hypothetical protein ACYC2R_05515 [Burkholderiales bacterium]